MSETDWALFAYRLPREPSTPRITVWRKIKRLGAVQLVDGLVALPADPATVEAFDWLADEVIEAGGESWTWRATGSKHQHSELRERLSSSVVEEYRALIAEARDPTAATRRTVARLRRELHQIQSRDRFGVKESEVARRAVERLAASVDKVDAEAVR